MKYLLDTNVLSDPVQKEPNAGVIARLDREAGRFAIPAPAWHEFSFGQMRASRGRGVSQAKREIFRGYVQSIIGRVPVIVYDMHAATWHAEERSRLERSGREATTAADVVDGMIAAIAKVHDLIVVTRNEKDFRPFNGIKIENWFS